MDMNRAFTRLKALVISLGAFVCFATLVCFVPKALAQSKSALSPFVAEVPVESQSLRQRGNAAELGLLDVLVRMSGSEDIRLSDDVLARSSTAIRYVEQFEYRDVNEELEEQGYSAVLRMHFSERLVRRLLSETGQKFWSAHRPSVLVWLVEDSFEHGKYMVGESSESALVQGLIDGAAYRGVPLSFPLMDFQDQVALGVQKLWAFDEEAILEASERYASDVILVGKYTTTSSGQLWSNWQFFYGDKSRVYDLRSEDQSQVGKDAIAPLADFLASMFAVNLSASDTEYYFARVQNVRSYRDYRGVIQALENIEAIADVLVDETKSDVMDLRVKSEASVNQLMSLLNLNKQLVEGASSQQDHLPVWQRSELGSSDNPLLYQWSN